MLNTAGCLGMIKLTTNYSQSAYREIYLEKLYKANNYKSFNGKQCLMSQLAACVH